MELEIERKWLAHESVVEAVRNPEDWKMIFQAYLAPNTRVRIEKTKEGEHAVICVKLRKTELTVEEYNFPIPTNDAVQLMEQLDIIEKTRYSLGDGFTLDKFSRDLKGLYLIEKEYASEEEAKADEVPEQWECVDVTGDQRFINANLADKKFDVTTGLSQRIDTSNLMLLEGNEEGYDL